MYDYLIVGAGLTGCVLAERIAAILDKRVLVVDVRNHIGGNAYDYYNNHGILVHKYGPHVFHTNSKRVFDYLSRFTDWKLCELRVAASVDGLKVPFPINLDTINGLYGLKLSENDLVKFFESISEPVDHITNSEDFVVSKIGRDLYNNFFKNYTKKQWGLWPSELEASVCSRIPIRTNRDSRYFTDRYQVIPKHGYTEMFKKMLKHRNVHLMLQTDYTAVREIIPHKRLIYTGCIDFYFNYRFGKLPYRSLTFSFETFDQEFYQSTAIVNYPNEYDFTRITEFKHITGQKHPQTTIAYEFPTVDGEPYYPVPTTKNIELYAKYRNETEKLPNVWFAGRLGTYSYYNMDQVVAQALQLFENQLKTIKP